MDITILSSRKVVQMKIKIVTVFLVLTLAMSGIASAERDLTNSHIWNPATDSGSFSDIQEMVNAILVDGSTQAGTATYTTSGSGADAMGQVYSAPIGVLVPTNGNSYIIIDTGNAYDVAGTPGDFASTDFGGSQDAFEMTIPLRAVDDQLAFDFRFGSEEYPEWVNSEFNDVFSAYIINDANVKTQVAFDDNGDIINVNNNFFDPTVPVAGTVFDGFTKLLTTTVTLSDYGISPSEIFAIEFEIKDVGDNIYDSATFIDNLRFTSGQTPGTDPTNEIPEFPTIALPMVAILGLAFMFQRRKE